MYQVIAFGERERWERAYAQLPRQDIFYRHGYVALDHWVGDGDPFLFIYEDGAGARVGYAFVRRPLRALPCSAHLEGDWYDIVTPDRGYGGPLCAAPDEALLRGFREAFEAHCRAAHIVCEFTRFHPLLENHRGLGESMAVRLDREAVLIDLARDEEALQAHYHPKHQSSLRRALRSGLELRVHVGAEAGARLGAFYALYRATMDKVGAVAHSYYSPHYLPRLFSLLGDAALLGAVYLDGRMVAGAVCLRDGAVLHYHMAGSEQAALPLGINVRLIHGLALWGRQQGCRGFFLGAGHVGRDSLFRFKHRFDAEGLRSFYVGSKVHLPQVYAQLVEGWRRQHGGEPPAHYVPAYRARPLAPSPPQPAAQAQPA